jgi:hypothetical protein
VGDVAAEADCAAAAAAATTATTAAGIRTSVERQPVKG